MRQMAQADWLESLLFPRSSGSPRPRSLPRSFAVNRQFFGTAIRRDGWRCRDRVVPWHWILLALDGHCACRVEDVEADLEPGDLAWIPPQASHAMQWSPTFRFAEIYFRLLDGKGRHLVTATSVVRWNGIGHVKPLLDNLADEIQLGGAHHELRLRVLLADLAIELWRQGSAQAPRTHGLTIDQQTRLIRLARLQAADGLTPTDLARHLGLSSNYFSRLFRKTFKIAPRLWLVRQRMRAAADLLVRSNLAVYQVADRFGYRDVPQFSRQFKRAMGVSPVHARRFPRGEA